MTDTTSQSVVGVLGFGGVPYNLAELLNGTLSITLFWMSWFIIVHIIDMWTKSFDRAPTNSKRKWWKATVGVYHHNKPEIALLTIMLTLAWRTTLLWYNRWVAHHNWQNYTDFVIQSSPWMLAICHVIMIIGVSCWIRVISPIDGKKASLSWLLMIFSAIGLSVFMLDH